MNNKVDAFVLFLSSNNYKYFVIHVYKCLLDTHTKYPIYCGVTSSVNQHTIDILSKIGIHVFKVKEDIINSKKAVLETKECTKYKNAFPKLSLLAETQFNKIVYLDSDLDITHNIDDLFNKPHMSAVEDAIPLRVHKEYKLGGSVFCSGLFVWDYKNHQKDAEEIIQLLDNLPENVNWHDQAVLNYYYKDWINRPELHLDVKYGLMIGERNKFEPVKNPYIKHFVQNEKLLVPFNVEVYHGKKTFKEILNYYTRMNKSISWVNTKYNLHIAPIHLENIHQKVFHNEIYYDNLTYGIKSEVKKIFLKKAEPIPTITRNTKSYEDIYNSF